MIKAVTINGEKVLFVLNKTYLVMSKTKRTIKGKLASFDDQSAVFECPIPGGKIQRQSIEWDQIESSKAE